MPGRRMQSKNRAAFRKRFAQRIDPSNTHFSLTELPCLDWEMHPCLRSSQGEDMDVEGCLILNIS